MFFRLFPFFFDRAGPAFEKQPGDGQLFLRCVAAVNDNVGRILDYLDESGLAKNTLVIYTADQGFFLGEHGLYDKRFFYEEALRMPFLVRQPGVVLRVSTSRTGRSPRMSTYDLT